MPDKTVAEKMRIRPDSGVVLLHAPDNAVSWFEFPADTNLMEDTAQADVIIVFATTQSEFEQRFSAVRSLVDHSKTLWICYPKGSKAAGLDISRDTIWPVVEALGFRPVGMVSVDERWSGFRLRAPE